MFSLQNDKWMKGNQQFNFNIRKLWSNLKILPICWNLSFGYPGQVRFGQVRLGLYASTCHSRGVLGALPPCKKKKKPGVLKGCSKGDVLFMFSLSTLELFYVESSTFRFSMFSHLRSVFLRRVALSSDASSHRPDKWCTCYLLVTTQPS